MGKGQIARAGAGDCTRAGESIGFSIEAAVAKVTKEHKVGMYDVGLKNSTMEVAEEVARHV